MVVFPHQSWWMYGKTIGKLWEIYEQAMGKWEFPARHGEPLDRWMVYFRENPNLKWMMTEGTSIFLKPPHSGIQC